MAFLFLILIIAYFVPMFVAGARGHPQTGAIAILNIFLGWTILGWVGALVWAAMAFEKRVTS